MDIAYLDQSFPIMELQRLSLMKKAQSGIEVYSNNLSILQTGCSFMELGKMLVVTTMMQIKLFNS